MLRGILVVLLIGSLTLPAFSNILQTDEEHGAGEDEKEFLFSVVPSKKDAIFKTGDKISYKVKVHNPFDVVQEGTVSFLLTSLDNKEVAQNSVKVKFDKRSSGEYSLSVPQQKEPGFYKISIMINVTEYDDTLRKVIGINPQQIVSKNPKPADFDKFWADAATELSAVKPGFKMTEQPVMEQNGIKVYLVEMQSLNNLTIRGWLTMPKNRKEKDKLPVWVVMPGYGGTGVKPIYAQGGLAVLSLNVRGQGNSRDVIHPTYDGYLTEGIEYRDKYILRGALMDGMRGIDFVMSRPELDPKNITVSGASLGGYFSIALASLDKRVKLCSSNNPVFSDWRALNSSEWPMSGLIKYSKARFVPLNKLLDNLDYFDLKNFTNGLECKALIGIGLLDHLAPAYNQYAMLNNIPGPYKLFVYPDLTHEVPQSIYEYFIKWMMDEYGIF
ncbi:acetylxylan esterase [Mucilaginibacter hurinus]|nr:acetylxylan esterase [Mucilaginibacter hurinus]